MHCAADKYGSYNSVEDAEAACSMDYNCQSVYDKGCDESFNDVYLCPLGSTQRTTGSHCIYEKKGISFY